MAKYLNVDVLDNGPAYLRANAVRVLLISSYTMGDSYATVLSRVIATATIAAADFGALAGADAANRTMSFLGKSGATASASFAGGANLHFAFTDGAAKVFAVTDETSDQAITSGNTVNFPAISPLFTAKQPT